MQQFKITASVTQRTRTVDEYLHDINRIPLLTLEEETELATRAREGDEEALARLVEANLRFVVSVAKQYQGRGLELVDLISEGNVGLMKAARKYDPTRGFKFISYAVWWIRQQILQALSEGSRTIRLPLNQVGVLNKVLRARLAFEQENGREPSDEELASLLGVPREKLADTMRVDTRGVSLDRPLGEDGDNTLQEILPDADAPAADAAQERESLRADLDEVMSVLDSRERKVIRLSFGIGCPQMSLEEIGEDLHLTRERVRQLRMKAIRKLSRPSVKSRLAQYLG